MAIIDVIRYEFPKGELVKRWAPDDIKMGSQLVVYPAQKAIFVKGGQIFDEFEAGTVTLHTQNIPLLNKIINLPFGSQSPFKAEIWFVNLTTKLDIKWGIATPILLEDPKYHVIIPVRGFGQYGFRVVEPRLFLETLIGNAQTFSIDTLDNYFKGKMLSQLTALISRKISMESISILEVNNFLVDLSEYCNKELNRIFTKYGVELVDFSIMSINISEDDPSVRKLREAKDLAARLTIAGRDTYQMERSFDVLDRAAGNEGVAGQMAAMGMGFGAGMGVGGVVGNMSSQMINTNPIAPPPIQEPTYFIYLNGQQIGNQTIHNIMSYISQGTANENTLVWQQGMPSWLPISQVSQLAQLLNQQTPPLVPPQIP